MHMSILFSSFGTDQTKVSRPNSPGSLCHTCHLSKDLLKPRASQWAVSAGIPAPAFVLEVLRWLREVRWFGSFSHLFALDLLLGSATRLESSGYSGQQAAPLTEVQT